MNSTYHLSADVIVFIVHEDDVYESGFSLEALELVQKHEKSKVVFDFSNVKVLHSEQMRELQTIIKLFKLSGKQVKLCGFDVYLISGLIHFLDDVHLLACKDLQEALDAF